MLQHDSPTVSVRGLTRRFRSRPVLDGLDLDLNPGTLSVLTGRSGCGKTTLLRLIAGLDAADAGEIRIGGQLASSPSPVIPPHLRGVGMVFQQPALWPHMSVAENVRFGLHKHPAATERVDEVLSLVGIDGLANRLPAELSGGEAARAALARAIAPAPTCLLLDEPLAHLDAGLRHDLAVLLRRLTTLSGAATLFVTHTPEDLSGVQDFAWRMEDGILA